MQGELVKFTSILNLASRKKYLFVFTQDTILIRNLLKILYEQGVIRGFKIMNKKIKIFLKYQNSKSILTKIYVVSKPSRRVNWNLNELNKVQNYNNFSGFFILRTSVGLLTSNFCLLKKFISGEVLLKIEV